MLLQDAAGVTACRLDDDTEGMAVDSLLASLIEGGARAAAFLTITGAAVLAKVLVAEPRNSDVRRADLREEDGGLTLGPWLPML